MTGGNQKTPQQLWPLSFDSKLEIDDIEPEQMYERNKRIINDFVKHTK